MLKIRNGEQIINVNVAKSYNVGDGPYAVSLTGGVTPPVISNGILLENGTDFLMLENGTEYLLQE
jgi:hypothetical protein